MLYQNSTSTPLIQFHSSQPDLIMIGCTNYGFYKSKVLGQGFGGIIYEGRNTTDSSRIAVKILNGNSLIQNHIPLQNLIQLTSIHGANNSHQLFPLNSLVQVFDVIQMDKTLMIMQLCEYNLSEFLSYNKQLSEPKILNILKNVIQALITVQLQGYHFTDLKPQNILITQNGTAKLGDLESLIMLNKIDTNVQLKFQNSIFGTLRYMPPELIGLGQHSPKNYTWSLGVILHEIIYGYPPFDLDNCHQNSTEQQKLLSINNFYENLFNLKICSTLSKDYPKCHLLLKKMLRFNAKNRVDLQIVLKLIQDKSQIHSHTDLNIYIPSLKISRSNSQNTIDTADDHKNELAERYKTLQNNKHKWNVSNQNQSNQKEQKYNQKHHNQTQTYTFPRLIHPYHSKDKGQLIRQFYQSFKDTYQHQTLKLIKQIESPFVLVRKLKHFPDRMANLLQKMQLTQESNNLKDHQMIVKNIWHQIKTSKVYSHLQTTMKIENLEINSERNHREVTLWNHFNQVIEMTQVHLISFNSQTQVEFLVY